MLRFALLGTPEVSVQGKSVIEQLAGRPLAMLAYLAVTRQPQPRGRLADLLWDDLPNEQAFKKVRNILPRLRPLVEPYIVITRDTVAFQPECDHWLDVDILRMHLAPSQPTVAAPILENILSLYRGEFLTDFDLRNAPRFDDWVTQQRAELHQLVLQGFHRLTSYYLQQGEYSAGLSTTKRILLLEPWREEAHRLQMFFLAKQGERTAALAQFALCQQVLAHELDIAPNAETMALYQQIRSGDFEQAQRSAETSSADTHENGTAKKQTGVIRPIVLLPANQPGAAPALLPVSPLSLPLRARPVQWDHIPHCLNFYGRTNELSSLTQWLGTNYCRLVGVFGIGGVGKSTLVSYWLRRSAESTARSNAKGATNTEPTSVPFGFQQIIWKSLQNAPPFAAFLQSLLEELHGHSIPALPSAVEEQLLLLLTCLRQQRALIVLDYAERILALGPDHEAYVALFRALAFSDHASCLILISRLRPVEFTRWEEKTPAVRSLHLEGLTSEASQQLLQGYGIATQCYNMLPLLHHYAGHPLALIVAAETIHELLGGNVARFEALRTFVFADLYERLEEQFTALPTTEQTILFWLAIERSPCSLEQLWPLLASLVTHRNYLDACRSLMRWSLLEPVSGQLGLRTILTEFLTIKLIDKFYHELVDDPDRLLVDAAWFNRYRLCNPQASLHVKTEQKTSLLQPLLERLTAYFGQERLIVYLEQLLERIKMQNMLQSCYAAANLQQLLLSAEVKSSTAIIGTPISHYAKLTLPLTPLSRPYPLVDHVMAQHLA